MSCGRPYKTRGGRDKNVRSSGFLNLKNPFGSLPHNTIAKALIEKQIHSTCRRLLGYFFICSTEFLSGDTVSREVPVRSSVRQGCPLSPLIFNMSIDSLVRLAADQADTLGYSMYGQRYSMLAYAEDLALIASGPREMQVLLYSGW